MGRLYESLSRISGARGRGLKRALSPDIRSGRRPCPVLLMIREIDCGGSERQITEIAKSLDREQFTPHVGCFLDQGLLSNEIRAVGVPIVQFPVRSFSKPGTLSAARLMGDYLREHE